MKFEPKKDKRYSALCCGGTDLFAQPFQLGTTEGINLAAEFAGNISAAATTAPSK